MTTCLCQCCVWCPCQ